jgi:hypothetical protein
MLKKSFVIAAGLVLAAVVLLLAFSSTTASAVTSPKVAMAQRLWSMSGHGDKTGEAFKHWNADGSIPTGCAKCHSTPGFLDFLGADGSQGGVVDKAPAIGTTVECLACHVDKTSGVLRKNSSVQFPSGAVVNGLGPEGLCMECHQGRESKVSLDKKIAGSGVPNDDTSSTKLSFSNIHYFAAAATQMGKVAASGYEYAGHTYDARFSHIAGYNACNTCHNPHSLAVNVKGCNTCHEGIKDPKDIRYVGSQVDYDGDGNIEEGMYYEIQHIMDKLYATIQRYARTVLGKAIGYDGSAYPYWFFDTNGDGRIDATEAVSTNGYNAFSVRLLKAVYNYQVAKKDPNNYAHNGKYVIELLYDSIEDLNQKLAVLTDLSAMMRTDEGHFDGAGEAWRHWDAEGSVPSGCARCHSATGLAKFISTGTNTETEPLSNGMLCTTCHTAPPALRSLPVVPFTSPGVSVSLGDASNLCLACHQGRESKASIDATIAANPTGTFSFKNVHYFAAGATFLGTEVKVGYEFAGKTYARRQPYPNHLGKFTTCIQCHMSTAVTEEEHNWTMRTHNVAEPMKENCVPCHGNDVSQPIKGGDPEQFDFEKIRPGNIPDYDVDGNTTESLKDEIIGLENALYTQIQTYTLAVQGMKALYDPNSYPYWFKDLNGNGVLDSNEATSANGFKFNAQGLRASFNLQISKKEPHGFIHNARYVAQLLVDSIGHLGGSITKYSWR